MKRFLYVCSTKYTMMNCINAVINNFSDSYEKSDIIIFLRTRDMINSIKLLSKTSWFKNIYVFKFINDLSSLEKGLIMINPDLLIHYQIDYLSSSRFKNNNNYTAIIAQSKLYGALFRKKNPCAKFYMIEEGISSYTLRTVSDDRRSFFYKLSNIFIFKNKLEQIDGYLVYEKQLLSDNPHAKKIIILPKINKCCYLKLKKIFKTIVNDAYKNYRLVYLGTPIYGIRGLLVEAKIEDIKSFDEKSYSILDEVLKISSKYGCVYRKHPLESFNPKNYENIKIDVGDNMWEVQSAESISDENILISFFSTAALTPKLLFGKEPYIIYLYKLINKEFYNADEIIHKIRKLYKNPEKVLVPTTLSEFRETLDYLNRNFNNEKNDNK